MSQEQILSRIFIQAYNWLVDEGYLCPQDPKSLIKFAQNIGIENYRDVYEYTTRSKFPTINVIKKICEVYSLNEEAIRTELPNVFDGVNKLIGNMIEVKDLEFFCGSGELLQHKIVRYYNDPTFVGKHYVTKAKGNSMEPTIFPSNPLYLKPLDSPDYLKKNEICAIIFQNIPIVKRLKKKTYDKNGNLSELTLESDNIDEHPDEIKVDVSLISWQFEVKVLK